jgi:hypothetical protein
MPDVDVPVDDSGRTMLMEVLAYAGGEPWLEIVTLLIGAGADVNRCDLGGRPVWDFAPTSGPSCVEIWRALIQASLDVNARGEKGSKRGRVCYWLFRVLVSSPVESPSQPRSALVTS